MSMEAGVVVDIDGRPIRWHLPQERSAGALPDNRSLWEFIWENQDRISGIAHTHPGRGLPGPSYTDVTTFSAIEAALGKRLNWWIASEDKLIVARWRGPDALSYSSHEITGMLEWLPPLREASKALTDERLAEECARAMEENPNYVLSVREGNTALTLLANKVISVVPHAGPAEVSQKIQALVAKIQ